MAAARRLRVVQFGTGFVGHFALRAILEHPELELVGVWVHSEAKDGRDAGLLAKTGRSTGLRATRSLEAVLALGADCICSAAGGDGREEWMADAHCRFLEAGSNVVSSSIVGMVDPRAHPDRALADRLDRAARRGGGSYLTPGIGPGLISDTPPPPPPRPEPPRRA